MSDVGTSNRLVEQFENRVQTSEPIDLRDLADGITPDDERAVARLIERYGSHQLDRHAITEFEEFRRAFPWIFDSQLVLDSAICAVVKSSLRLGYDFLATADSIKRAHPAAANAVDRVMSEQFGAGAAQPPISPELKELPSRFGPPDLDGFPRFKLHTKVGEDADGVVYEASDYLHAEFGTPASISIKVFRDRMSPLDKRWPVSARTSISGPSVAQLFDLGVAPSGETYAATQRVNGISLDQWKHHQNPSMRARIAMTVEIAKAIELVHARGLVHAKLKPDSILVEKNGQVVVSEIGTPELRSSYLNSDHQYGPSSLLAFVAPEAWDDPVNITPVADVYQFGGLVLWLLTGRLPNGATVHDAYALLHEGRTPYPAKTAGLPQPLASLLNAALSPNPDCRPQSVSAVRSALERWLAHEPIAGQESKASRVRLLLRRHPVLITAGVACVTGIGLTVGSGYTGQLAENRMESLAAAHAVDLEERDEQVDELHDQLAESQRTALMIEEKRIQVDAERIRMARDIIRQWKEAILTRPSTDPALPMLLLSIVEDSPLADDEMRRDLLRHSSKSATRVADEARRSEPTLEGALWQFVAGQMLLQEERYAEAVPYLERARNLLRELAGPSDPLTAAAARLLETARTPRS